jgi:Holliday junction resolvase RusA-like endonuclease
MYHSLTLRLKPMGKARPRVTKRGHAYIPSDYRAYKKEAVRQILEQIPNVALVEDDVGIECVFTTKTGKCRSDVDNCTASIFDCMQDAQVIKNDRQVKYGTFWLRKWDKETEDTIYITIYTMDDE